MNLAQLIDYDLIDRDDRPAKPSPQPPLGAYARINGVTISGALQTSTVEAPAIHGRLFARRSVQVVRVKRHASGISRLILIELSKAPEGLTVAGMRRALGENDPENRRTVSSIMQQMAERKEATRLGERGDYRYFITDYGRARIG